MTKRPTKRIHNTGYSSARYGACECCEKHVSEVHMGTPDDGRTHVFGHASCVLAAIGLPSSTEVSP